MTDRFVTVPDSLELPAAVKVGVDRLHDSTVAGRALLTGADAAAQRTSLGLGDAAQHAHGDYATAEQGAKADASDVAALTLTAPLALTVPEGHPAGQVYRVVFTQDGTGGHTVTYGDQPVTVDTTAGASTLVEFFHDGTTWLPSVVRTMAGHVLSRVRTDGTDQTARLQAEIDALMASGGGTLVLPEGTVTLTGTITLVNDGATPPKQAPLRLVGQGAHWSGRGTAVVGGTILDIRGTDAYGKIKTNGLGLLSLEGLTIRDTSGGTTPMVYTTNTTLHVSGCSFVGSKYGTACDQDAIILGGTQQVEGFGGWDDGFQGYGTIIEDSFFTGIRRGVLGRAFANAIKVARLTAWTTCGNSSGGFIEWNGRPGTGGQVAAGGTISDCLIEMVNFQYGIVLRYTIGMDVRGNSFYDFGASSLAAVLLDTTATGNRVINGASVSSTKQAVADLAGGNIVLSMEDGVPTRWGNQFHSFTKPTTHGGQAMSMDLYSGNLAYLKAQAQSGGHGQVRVVTRTGAQFTDGVTTNGSTTITSATAHFVVGDLGLSISGTGIPNVTTIVQVMSATTVVVSKAATASATGVTFRVARPESGTEVEQVSFGRQHWCALGTAPSVAVGGGAGVGATASVSGVDVAGRISVTTGTGAMAGTLASWTPAIGYKTTVRVQLTARNAAAAALLADGCWVSGANGAQAITVLGVPADGTLYEIDYLAIES